MYSWVCVPTICLFITFTDIALMDKIIVHDMENMLFGWMDFDCRFKVFLSFDLILLVVIIAANQQFSEFLSGSRSVNVASSIRKKHVNSGNVSSNIRRLTGVAIILAHILILCHFYHQLMAYKVWCIIAILMHHVCNQDDESYFSYDGKINLNPCNQQLYATR